MGSQHDVRELILKLRCRFNLDADDTFKGPIFRHPLERTESSKDEENREEIPRLEPTFHPFPRLPDELRITIWKLALPPPRIVQLRMIGNTRPRTLQAGAQNPALTIPGSRQRHYITTDIPIYPLLSACVMSRQIMLETYSLRIHSRGDWQFYAHGKEDWVMLSDVVLKNNLFEDVRKCSIFENSLRGLKRLVFAADFLLNPNNNGTLVPNKWLLSFFCSLETLILFTKYQFSTGSFSETWGNENLCLLTDEEYLDKKKNEEGFDAGLFETQMELRENDIEELEDMLIEEMGKEAATPNIQHMWLCPRWQVEKVALVDKEQGDRRRPWRPWRAGDE